MHACVCVRVCVCMLACVCVCAFLSDVMSLIVVALSERTIQLYIFK